MFIMFGISILYARLNRTEQADKDLERLWENCRRFDWKWAEHFRRRTILKFICVPGEHGSAFVSFIYRLAHCVVRFN